MVQGVTAFLLGNLVILNLPLTPAQLSLLNPLLVLVPVGGFCCRLRRLLPFGGFLLGIAQSLLAIETLLSTSLPEKLERRDQVVIGEVEEMPVVQDGITRFRFVTHLWPKEPALDGARLALSWHHAPEVVRAGQVWMLNIRVNRRSGSLNPGLFDYEAWLFAERISGRGYVRSNPAPVLLESRLAPVGNLRDEVRAALAKVLGAIPGSGLVCALVIGDTSSLSAQEWQLVQDTGVIHLLIISGLHIGLVAWMTYKLVGALGGGLHFRSAVTLLAAGGYALLAGWGLPVQRAFIMLAVFVFGQTLRRRVSPSSQYFTAVFFCLLCDPFATLRRGFWLSFLAVGLLLFFLQPGRQTPWENRLQGRWAWLPALMLAAGRAQWIIFVGMAPLLLSLGSLPANSFFTNLLAVPYVGLLLVPALLFFTLLCLLLPGVGELVSPLIITLVEVLWEGLRLARDLGHSWYVEPVGTGTLLVSLSGGLLLLLARGLLPAWPGVIAVGLLVTGVVREKEGVEIRFLDVGQGLAVLVMAKSTVTVYDTGPGYGSRYNAGSQVVVPSIRQAGYPSIDFLVISHGDNDHAGGLDAALAVLSPRGRLLTPDSCHGPWRDGVTRFEPMASIVGAGANNASCLLMVTVGDIRILLTGDIEKDAEDALLDKIAGPVHIMSVPHHGSATSSSPALLNRLMPDVAIASVGYNNRFGHPHPKVVSRYRARHARFIDTAGAGAVRIFLRDNAYHIVTERAVRPAIWRRSP